MEDKFITLGDIIGGVGYRTTHLYPPKINLVIDRYYRGFWTSHHHNTAPPIASLCSRGYSVHTTGCSSFCVASGYSKGAVDTRTTHISSHRVDCFLMVKVLCNPISGVIHP